MTEFQALFQCLEHIRIEWDKGNEELTVNWMVTLMAVSQQSALECWTAERIAEEMDARL